MHGYDKISVHFVVYIIFIAYFCYHIIYIHSN